MEEVLEEEEEVEEEDHHDGRIREIILIGFKRSSKGVSLSEEVEEEEEELEGKDEEGEDEEEEKEEEGHHFRQKGVFRYLFRQKGCASERVGVNANLYRRWGMRGC